MPKTENEQPAFKPGTALDIGVGVVLGEWTLKDMDTLDPDTSKDVKKILRQQALLSKKSYGKRYS